MCVCVCVYEFVGATNLNSEEVQARFGLLCHGEKKNCLKFEI